MENIYEKLYPGADWTYTYECPNCGEPVPLEKNDDIPFVTMMVGHCKSCHLNIEICKELYERHLKEKGE